MAASLDVSCVENDSVPAFFFSVGVWLTWDPKVVMGSGERSRVGQLARLLFAWVVHRQTLHLKRLAPCVTQTCGCATGGAGSLERTSAPIPFRAHSRNIRPASAW